MPRQSGKLSLDDDAALDALLAGDDPDEDDEIMKMLGEEGHGGDDVDMEDEEEEEEAGEKDEPLATEKAASVGEGTATATAVAASEAAPDAGADAKKCGAENDSDSSSDSSCSDDESDKDEAAPAATAVLPSTAAPAAPAASAPAQEPPTNKTSAAEIDVGASAAPSADASASKEATVAASVEDEIKKAALSEEALGDEEDAAEEEDGDDSEEGDDAGEGAEEEEAGDEAAAVVEGDDAAEAAEAPIEPEKKRRGKPKDPMAPKAPLRPFSLFCSQNRERLIEENPALKGALKETMQALGAAWEKVPEEEKAKMQAVFEKEKKVYDEALKVYKTTPAYKAFRKRLQDWLDTREMKKLEKQEKLRPGGCPKMPLRSYGAFGQSIRAELPSGLTAGEAAKQISERWQALSPAEQAKFNDASRAAREKWTVELEKYKRTDGYHAYLDSRAALEKKQAKRRLKFEFEDLVPKRPMRARDLFRTEKGVGGGLAEVSKAFDELPQEDKERYKTEAEKLKQKYDEDIAAFRETADGRRLRREDKAAERKADLRAARLKYLVDAPKRPPTAKALFVAEKKEQAEAGTGAGSATPAALGAMWEKMTPEEQGKFEKRVAQLREEFDKKWEEFTQTPAYKALRKVEEGFAKGAASGKAKDKAKKAKDKLAKAKATAKGKAKAKAKAAAVQRPDSMPTAPPSVVELWAKERKAAGAKASLKEWAALPAEEKAAFDKKRVAAVEAYRKELAAWEKSKDGKRYQRKKEAVATQERTKRKLEAAFNDYFKGAPPKRPPAPMFIFAQQAKGAERAPGKVNTAWAALSAEEKATWAAKREALNKEYEEKIEGFKKSAAYKKVARAKSKAGAKSSGKGAPAPKSMPKKPLLPMLLYSQKTGLKGSIADAAKAFNALSEEERQKWKKESETLKEVYKAEMMAWSRTSEGKKHLKAQDTKSRKEKETRAKEKFLKGPNAPVEPKMPPSSFKIFHDEERPKLTKASPGLSGAEIARNLGEKWKSLESASRQSFEKRAADLKAEYEKQLKAYRCHPAVKKYEREMAKLKGTSAKASKEKDERDEAYQLIYGVPKKGLGSLSMGGGRGSGRGGGGGRGGKKSDPLADLGISDSEEMGSDSDSLDVDSD